MIATTLTFSEQDFHTFRYVDSEKSVKITDERRQSSQDDRLGHTVLCEIFATKCGDLKVELDHKGTIQSLQFTAY